MPEVTMPHTMRLATSVGWTDLAALALLHGFPGDEQLLHRVDRDECAVWDPVRERRVEDELYHVVLRAIRDGARDEEPIFHFARDHEQGMREVDDDAAQGHVRRERVLIRVGADDEHVAGRLFFDGLEDAESR